MASSVRVIEWPTDGDALEALAAAGAPRLVIVDEGAEPPVGADCCQDWMWRTGDEREMRLRLHQLSLRALAHGQVQPYIDSLGFLHVGLRSAHLPPKEEALAAVLLQHFNDTVSPKRLIEAGWPNGIKRPSVLATRISSLRSRLTWVGLEVRGSRSKGYSMRPKAVALPLGNVGGFEDELEAARSLHEKASHSTGDRLRRTQQRQAGGAF